MPHSNNSYSAFNFIIEIDGARASGFAEVEAITTDGNVVEYREGEDRDRAFRMLQGLRKFGQITLKRGYTASPDLWNWWQLKRQGRTHRKSGVILLLNEAREPELRWAINEAWIKKWEGPPMNATTNEVAIGSLEIVCEGVALPS
jgi:phage tail-like protein